MKLLQPIGRFLYAIPIIILGFAQITNASMFSRVIPGYFPYPLVWVYVTAVALLLAGIAILIGRMSRLASTLLGVMILIFALTIHLPGTLNGGQFSTASFLKDVALSGAAFFIAANSKS